MGVKGGKSYFFVDNSNGDMPLYQGRDGEERTVVDAGLRFEADSYTCGHCQNVVLKNPARVRPRAWCRRCNSYLCEKPGCSADCLDIHRMIELQQKYPNLPIVERDKDGFATWDIHTLISRHKPR